MTRRPTARSFRLSVPLVVAAAGLGLAACQMSSPVQTDVPYVAGDGVPVQLGDSLEIGNLVIVAEKEGGPGTISGAVVNRNGESRTITFAVEGAEPVTAEVPAHDQQRISGGSLVTLPSVPEPPGAMVKVQISTEGSGASVVQVPVLPPYLYYEDLAPTSGESGATTSPAQGEGAGSEASPTSEPTTASH